MQAAELTSDSSPATGSMQRMSRLPSGWSRRCSAQADTVRQGGENPTKCSWMDPHSHTGVSTDLTKQSPSWNGNAFTSQLQCGCSKHGPPGRHGQPILRSDLVPLSERSSKLRKLVRTLVSGFLSVVGAVG